MKIKVSDYIAGWMAEKKIKHVFTVTGGGAMHLNDSFGKHPKLKCVYNHHEQACAMACPYESLRRCRAADALSPCDTLPRIVYRQVVGRR